MRRLAIFDFCETLVDFQTADAFVDFVRDRRGNSYMGFMNFIFRGLSSIRFYLIMNKLFPGNGFAKKIKLLQLRGISNEELKGIAGDFYSERIKPGLIDKVITELVALQTNGYEICVASAGYTVYLEYFNREFSIQHLVATEIAFDKKSGRCKGIIAGKDCIGKEKARRVDSYFGDSDIDFSNSVSYSDSRTDLPLMFLTGKATAVSRDNGQDWAKKYAFEELIWNQQ